jgi:hypothetical protein
MQSSSSGMQSSSAANTISGGGGGTGGNTATSTAPSTSQIQQSVLALSVYFDDLRYVSIQENPVMTVDTLVGLLGNQDCFMFVFQLVEFNVLSHSNL